MLVKDVEQFYLRASLAGYAGSASKMNNPDVPGSKIIIYEEDKLHYRDEYVAHGEWSGGTTLIWLAGRPLWIMQYNGWCQNDNPEVLDFLKRALSAAYSKSEFFGGRGPATYSELAENECGLAYFNRPTGCPMPNAGADFTCFSGREHIVSRAEPGKELFWHSYSGRWWEGE